MEKEVVNKDQQSIPVTRLRRRLSVEAEDVKSPSTQSTPTKKRGGRLAAKPQLELIDENATEVDKPKRTRKSIARDAEPEEKAVTPSRRSTRIRSNTSIVSETPVEVEDKGTPSKRSTRIKSNTSIVADAVQYSESPRAKRAARRTSQVGSDNEAPVTPARQTRRTRKDSTSSIDKQVEPADTIGSQIKEVIIEEAEDNTKETKIKETSTKDKNETRKSPRLVQKTGKNLSPVNDNKENEPQSMKNSNKDKSEATENSIITSTTKTNEEFNLSVSTTNLINELDEKPKKGKDSLNKTASAVEETLSNSKRHRTKSWTTITSSPSNDKTFLSDTEAITKKNKRKSANMSGSGDHLLNTSKKSIQENKEQDDNKEALFNSAVSDKAKNNNDKSQLDIETVSEEISTVNTSLKVNKSIMNVNESSTKIKEDNLNSSQKSDLNFTEKYFGEAPSGMVQSLVFIEDSDRDSNADNAEKETVTKKFESEDQCVPVVVYQLEEGSSKEAKNDLSYEPMDIDETMPENVSITGFTDKNKSVKEADKGGLEKRKSFHNVSQVNNVSIDDPANKSQRKSTILDMEDGKQITLNKSNRKSLINDDIENQSFTKSKRKSSISNVNDDNNLNKDCNETEISISEETVNKSLNKSSRKSSTSDPVNDDTNNIFSKIDESVIANKSMKESKRKSSVTDNNVDMDNKSSIANQSTDDNIANKSKRKSTISTKETSQAEIDSTTNISNKSKRKSSLSNINIEEEDNKLTEVNHSVMKNADKSLVTKIVDSDEVDCSHNHSLVSNHDDKINKSTNDSKRKSSILNTTSDNNNLKKSKKKFVDVTEDENMNKDSVKSKRKSSISKIDVENDVNSKSKRKSSISNLELQILDKTTDENKSTLVLSQIKDTSETSVQKDIYELNETNDSAKQLSKSANVPYVNNKETEKKNLSLTYSTSTPLQQKSFKKLGMQINSSIIAPNSVTKSDDKNFSKSQKEISMLSRNDEESELSDEEDDDDDDEDGSEEESVDKSKLIDNEADEASDDYESGDSRDEDEREYEEQNEIVEKGETLDSEEDDFSDDSEYEKDSFIVESDEEDNDLLSGSGDDLSMSADELSMSAKSKKKFNERKTKEQKKASREMFEARHKLNESDKSEKSDKLKMKKNNRQRLQSSESESEEDIGIQPKKYRRARIDSSQDISINQSEADKAVSKKKKKVKRLSESVCEENPTNEKEISIHENKEIEKDDPLSLQNVIKEEPKTPQKDLNISTVAITNMEEVEEVEIDENVSITKSNQTTDPLQATLVQDEAMEDDSEESISENEEITQNFESVLNDLNKKSKKVKTLDISMNLDKKNKQKSKEPIVEELNLTQVKSSKKKQVHLSADAKKLNESESLTNKNIENVNKSVAIQEEGSTDSIDIKLLFNEDSTDSEIKEIPDKQIAEDFIPLKRTEGKTNLLETSSISVSGKNESILNVSKTKKNKCKSSQPEEIVSKDTEGETSFFIDTTGTHADANKSVTNTSIKGSAKKNKNKKDVSFANIEEIKNDDNSNDAPLEVSFVSEKNMNKSKQDLNNTRSSETEVKTPSESAKKKKKNKNKKVLDSSQTNIEEQNVEDTVADDVANQSTEVPVVTSTNKKKKKKLSISQSEVPVADVTNKSAEVPDITVTDSNKKKKKLSVSQSEEPVNEAPTEISLNSSAKKQKQKKGSESLGVEEKIIIEESTAVIIEEKISKKRKRKPSANLSIEEAAIKEDTKTLETPQTLDDSAITTNQKKKRKIKGEGDSATQAQGADTVPGSQQEQEGSAKKKSKKKNKNMTKETQGPKLFENESDSTKKSKKRKERDDDDGKMLSKVVKQSSFDSVHVPRLPANILKQLDDKPKNVAKAKLISTTSFQVEEARKRRNKPSNYLEQSVYLNDSVEEQTKKSVFKKPKVLPFTPTASTSDYGFTTKFSVNVIPQEVQFIAQSSDTSNFKKDLLQKNRIKRLGKFENYKRHRNIKISKF